MTLGSFRYRSRKATGSAFARAATSSIKHSCANVFCSRAGERSGPVKNGDGMLCVSERSDVILPVPLARSVHVAGHVRGHSVAIVAIGARFGRGSSGHERFRREARQRPRNHIPGRGIPGPVPQHRGPRFVVPGHDISVAVQGCSFIHHECESVIFAPGHFVFSRQLHAHRFAHRLRKQRGVEADRVGAVQAIATRTPAEDHVHIFRFEAEQHCRAASHRPDALRRRVKRSLVALNVRHGTRAPHRAVHLVRIVVSRLQNRRCLRQLLVNILGIHQQRVARRLLRPQVIVEIGVARQARPGAPGNF